LTHDWCRSGASVAPEASAAWRAAHPAPASAPDGLLGTGHDFFASVTADDGIAGVARGAVVGAWLFVNGMWVAETHRRTGIAGMLLRSLTDAVSGLPVRHAFLQVEADNDGARALYARFGFHHHHSYVYRVAP